MATLQLALDVPFGPNKLVGTPPPKPRVWRWHWVWASGAVAIMAVGFWFAWDIVFQRDWFWGKNVTEPGPLAVGAEFTVFAFLYIAAMAIERALEPISVLIPPTTTEENKDKAKKAKEEAEQAKPDLKAAADKALQASQAVEALAEDSSEGQRNEANEEFRKAFEFYRVQLLSTHDKLNTAADEQTKVEDKRIARGLALWAAASVLGFLLSGYLGLFLLDSVTGDPATTEPAVVGSADPDETAASSQQAEDAPGTDTQGQDSQQGSHPPRWPDILVTGLAIGGGTKPLHDLVTRVQKAKEEAEDKQGTTT